MLRNYLFIFVAACTALCMHASEEINLSQSETSPELSAVSVQLPEVVAPAVEAPVSDPEVITEDDPEYTACANTCEKIWSKWPAVTNKESCQQECLMMTTAKKVYGKNAKKAKKEHKNDD